MGDRIPNVLGNWVFGFMSDGENEGCFIHDLPLVRGRRPRYYGEASEEFSLEALDDGDGGAFLIAKTVKLLGEKAVTRSSVKKFSADVFLAPQAIKKEFLLLHRTLEKDRIVQESWKIERYYSLRGFVVNLCVFVRLMSSLKSRNETFNLLHVR